MAKFNDGSGNPRNGIRLLKLAVTYLLIGLALGLFMAISGQFQLRPVHTHVNLLGWATLGVTGLVYCQFPRMGATALANWHIRLHSLGLPVMMVALALYALGHHAFEPLIGVGSLITIAGIALFAINLFRTIDTVRAAEPRLDDGAVAAAEQGAE